MASATHGFDIEELQQALAAAGVGVWSWSLETNRISWTPEVYRIFGVDPADFDGSLDSYLGFFHPDDVAPASDRIETALAEKSQDFRNKHRIIRPDGELRWLDGKGRVLLDDEGQPVGMTGTVSDVTDIQAVMDELAKSRDAYRLYTELASDYIYQVDLRMPSLVPTVVMGSFERTTSYTLEELEACGGWEEVMHPEDRDSHEAMQSLQQGRPAITEYRIVTKSGAIRWLRDRIHPTLDEEGKLIGMTGGVQDITDRKDLEEQLSHAQKMEALAHLAGGVAHDFNNLLTVMYAGIDLLDAEAVSARAQEGLGALSDSVKRASDLTSSLLTFGRRQVTRRSVRPVASVVDRAVKILTRAAGERVDLRTTDSSEGAAVLVDESQLELVLLNLVVNARDAMPEGGLIMISTSTTELGESPGVDRPAELPAGRYCIIDVSDEGTGIPPEVIPRLFEPFFTTKEVGRGTGLGLSTVHGVVSQHDGSIRVHSDLGVGTTFRIFLPATEMVYVEESHRPFKTTEGGTESILLVEDEAAVRNLASRILSDLGYQVVAVASAEEAMDLWQGVDLLISDVRLPGMAGTELATRIADEEDAPAILLMSGLVEDDEQQSVVASGRFHFLAKPFTPDALARSARESLHSKAGKAE